MMSSTSAFFFGTVITHKHTHTYTYIWNILNLQISFLSMLREFKMLYILWREISLSLARGCNILFSCQFFSSLFFVQHPMICLSLLTNLFNKYGYHFSFHRSMMKEFTIISTPDLCFILFTDVWWKIHDFQFQAVHIQRYFSNISRHWIHNSSSEQLVKLFLSFFLSFFLFHFQQGSNKT